MTMHFVKGTQYKFDVSRVVQARRNFMRKGVLHYVHDIFFLVDGMETKCEYVCVDSLQDDFVSGQKQACFRVDYIGDKGVEIMPCNSPAPEPELEVPKGFPGNIDRDTVNVDGESHTVALNVASRILCSKIEAGLAGGSLSEIRTMLAHAYVINEWLVDPTKVNNPVSPELLTVMRENQPPYTEYPKE